MNRTKLFATTSVSAQGGELLTQPSITFAKGSWMHGLVFPHDEQGNQAPQGLSGGFVVADRRRRILVRHSQTQFFPKDLQYFSYPDIWLPENSPLSETKQTTTQVEAIVRRVASNYGERLQRRWQSEGCLAIHDSVCGRRWPALLE